jgi:hypothetical protein
VKLIGTDVGNGSVTPLPETSQDCEICYNQLHYNRVVPIGKESKPQNGNSCPRRFNRRANSGPVPVVGRRMKGG